MRPIPESMMTGDLWRTHRLPLFSVFIDQLSFGLMMPILPFFAMRLGADAIQVTLVGALVALPQLVSTPFWGKISDRIGRPRTLIVCIAGSSIGFALLAMATSLKWLYAGRLITGLFACCPALTQAFIADAFAPPERSFRMTATGFGISAGLTVGPVLGGILAFTLEEHHVLAYQRIALCAVALHLANIAVVAMLPRLAPMPTFSALRDAIKPAATSRALFILSLVSFVAVFVYSGVDWTLALFANEHLRWTSNAYGAQKVGYALALIGLSEMSCQFVYNRVRPKPKYQVPLLLLGIALAALGLFVLAGTFVGALLILACVILGAAYGFIAPLTATLVTDCSPAHRRGHELGRMHAAAALGRICGPVSLGALYNIIGSRTPYVIAALLLLGLLPSVRKGLFDSNNQSTSDDVETR